MNSIRKITESLQVCSSGDICGKCAYKNHKHCMKALMGDILFMMQNITPRVMTITEFESIEKNTDVYLERRDRARIDWIGKAGETGKSAFFDRASFLIQLYKKDYGKTWRCWTRHPEVADRLAVKWE